MVEGNVVVIANIDGVAGGVLSVGRSGATELA